jgi:hypothetical protein
MDFEGLQDKAESMVEEHADQIDKGIDKAADLAADKFGHEQQIVAGADKLKDLLPGGE